MSAREVAHRAIEQGKRAIDSWKTWQWEDFGRFGGTLDGLPGLVPSRAEALRHDARREASFIRDRHFQLLNRKWPATSDWNALWHLDPVTATRWPGVGTFAFRAAYRHVDDKGDVKFVWELNRLQFLPVLALANECDLIRRILQSWMSGNPPFQGINWTSGIEAASRIVSLLATIAILEPEQRQSLDADARSFLDAHLFWIARYPSLYSSANNHRVAELVAQLLGAICAPGLSRSSRLLDEAGTELEGRMQQLFSADGVGVEQSTTYAAYALEWFALAGMAADVTGQSLGAEYRSRAARAAAHFRWLMDDAAEVPAIGDGDETRVLAFGQKPERRYAASVSALVARWLADPEISPPASGPDLRDLWGVSEIEPSHRLPLGMVVFEQGGYTAFREPTPQGTFVCIFDHGPLGFESIAAHGHADALSIWVSWGDEPIFIDAGTYLYHSDRERRDYFRSTSVHNTLALEGANQSRIAGAFNWSRHAGARIIERKAASLTAEHDGYRKRFGLLHRRTVAVRGGYFVVEDKLLGMPRRKGVRWEVGFTLAPEIRSEPVQGAMILTTPRRRVLRVLVDAGCNALRSSQTVFSPSFGRIVETTRIAMTGVKAEDANAVARLRIERLSDA